MIQFALTAEEAEVASGLDSGFAVTVLQIRDAARREGIEAVLISGHRPRSYQAALYADPAREKISGVTTAPPGMSKHEIGFAADLAGKRNTIQQLRYGAIVEEYGMEWGGRYKKADWNHFEHPASRDMLAKYLEVRLMGLVR